MECIWEDEAIVLLQPSDEWVRRFSSECAECGFTEKRRNNEKSSKGMGSFAKSGYSIIGVGALGAIAHQQQRGLNGMRR
jgi:hypothetical protein